MKISKLSQRAFLAIAMKALLKHGALSDDDLAAALQKLHRMFLGGCVAQDVIDGHVDIAWREGDLWVSHHKEAKWMK